MVSAYGLGLVTVGGVALGGALWSTLWWYEGERCEKPKYSVLKVLQSKKRFLLGETSEVELRRYEPYIIAEATITGLPMKKAMSKGFMTVAKYIFGDNQKASGEGAEKVAMTAPVRTTMPSEKIAMTAPVRTTVEQGDANASEDSSVYKISFVMPSDYSKDTLPRPNNQELKITEVAAHDLAAIKFNGSSPTPAQIEAKALVLRAALKEAGLETEGEIMVYQYHPPWAPPFIRLNEVLLKVQT